MTRKQIRGGEEFQQAGFFQKDKCKVNKQPDQVSSCQQPD